MRASQGNRRWQALGDKPTVAIEELRRHDPFERRVEDVIKRIKAYGRSWSVLEQLRREHGSAVLEAAIDIIDYREM